MLVHQPTSLHQPTHIVISPQPLPHQTLYLHPSIHRLRSLLPPMASTARDSHSLPTYAAAPASALLDDHPVFLPSSNSTFLDDQAASFHLPSSPFPAATVHEPLAPPSGRLPSPPPSSARKPRRKRPRASRRPPTTVLTTDTSNFRAMVQEFTGFPAPPPIAVPMHLHHGGVLFGDAAAAAPGPFQLLRRSPLRFPASHACPPNCTTSSTSSLVLDALAHFAETNAIPPPAAAAAATPSSGSELYSSFGPMLAGAVQFDDGFEAAEGERAGSSHGHFSYRH